MRYFASRLDIDKPLFYKVNSHNTVFWYSYHRERWIVEREPMLDGMVEITEQQFQSCLCMRELVG